jgi:hypothetical protein
MDALALVSLALGAAWASGLNLYATIVVLGLLNLSGVVILPESLQVLSHPLVLAVAGLVYLIEFFADKVPGLDSLWDAVHTFIRVPAGALLAAGAVADVAEPYQVAAALLGGAAVAFGSHTTKAGGRVVINTSPEPVSNWIVSLLEDILVIVGLILAVVKPILFLGLFALFCVFALWLLPRLWRGLKAAFRRVGAFFGGGREEPKKIPSRSFDLPGPGSS